MVVADEPLVMRHSRPFWLSLCVVIWSVVLAGMFAPKAVVDPLEVNQFDKLLHLGALMAMVLSARCAFTGVRFFWFWGAALFLAFALEALQPILQTSREFNELDLVANLAGVAAAALVLWLGGFVKSFY